MLSERKDGTYLLPCGTQFESKGCRTASNRSLQWYERVVKPIFEAKDDYEIMYLLAKKLGFADQMFKNIKVDNNLPEAEDILREINRGGWSTGYCGQSPERLKLHRDNQKDFDVVSLRAKEGPCKGDYYGLPWPCWGAPELKHPGTHTLYNTNLHVKDGGSTFRARFGVERNGQTLLAENSYRWVRRSRTDTPNSPTASSRSSAGTSISPKPNWRRSCTSAGTAPIPCPGR